LVAVLRGFGRSRARGPAGDREALVRILAGLDTFTLMVPIVTP
jgi:alkyl sulfatase BDS1-like metallo-beta-lactamase superfamily hydrolase